MCLIKVFFAHPSLLLRTHRVHPRTRGRSSSKLLAGVPSPHPPDADNANCLLALSCSCSSSLFFLPPPFLGICAEGVYASNFLKTTRPAHSLELGPRLICTLFFLLLPATPEVMLPFLHQPFCSYRLCPTTADIAPPCDQYPLRSSASPLVLQHFLFFFCIFLLLSWMLCSYVFQENLSKLAITLELWSIREIQKINFKKTRCKLV